MVLRSDEASKNWAKTATIDRGSVAFTLVAALLSSTVVAALAIMVETSPDNREVLDALRGAGESSWLCEAPSGGDRQCAALPTSDRVTARRTHPGTSVP